MMSRESIFVDTGAWVALADRDDAHHQKAVSVYPSLLKTYRSLVTSNLVIAEAYVIILNELGHNAAIDFIERINASPRIMKIYSNGDIETEAVNILKKYADHDFSYTDAASFTIMRRQKIGQFFGFDKHFVTAGFVKIP